jgi:hypothetical protein
MTHGKLEFIHGHGWHDEHGKVYQEQGMLDSPDYLVIGYRDRGIPSEDTTVTSCSDGYHVLGSYHRHPFRDRENAWRYLYALREFHSLGAHNWPLRPSRAFPGEKALSCPNCHSTDVTLSVRYPFHGSGPGGIGRLGDRGTMQTARCNGCGHCAESERP